MKTRAVPVLERATTRRHDRRRHIVELDGDGRPKSKCLCGYLWDVYPISHGESICQDCVDEQRRRESGRGTP